MGIKKWVANSDNTITNAFRSDLSTRATASNMGESDVLETFSIWAQASTGSAELSRILIKFPTTEISTARTATDIPASGNVNFYLRMHNVRHAFTTPKNFTLSAKPITKDWEEGHGLDMESYKDLGRNDGSGSTWYSSSLDTAWTTPGGDFNEQREVTASFSNGTEDLEIEITEIVEEWLAGTQTNYGVGIHLTSSQESFFSSSNLVETAGAYGSAHDNGVLYNLTGSKSSYYTKKFFGRNSQYVLKRPVIEARWNSSTRDNRGNFYLSSSLADATDNLNTIYLYNYVKGKLKNIPDIGDGAIYVRLYTSSSDGTLLSPNGSGSQDVKNNFVTGGINCQFSSTGQTGIYTASFALNTTASTIYDRWFAADTSVAEAGEPTATCFHTGTIIIDQSPGGYNYGTAVSNNPNPSYVLNISNLRFKYTPKETARFRVYTREHNWSPNIYTKAQSEIETTQVESLYYRVYRVIDEFEVVPYGTGSTSATWANAVDYTLTSYDVSGNYFDLDMNICQPGYAYGIQFLHYSNGKYVENEEKFKFRVD